MTENLVQWLAQVPVPWRTFILAAVPVTELRLTIPLGLHWGLTPWEAFWLSLAGNFLPVFPLLFFLPWLLEKLERFPLIGPPVRAVVARTHRRSDFINTWGLWGLVTFVGIPAPGTGAWSGALAASLLGMSLRTAALGISLGVALAGVIVTLASLGVWQLARLAAWETVLALAVVGLVVYLGWRWRQRKR